MDLAAFQRPDLVLANSPFSAQRLQKYYHREAQILFAPVDTEQFAPAETRDDYYVTVGRLVPLKGIDLMVKAFTTSGRRLIVIGDGPQLDELRAMAGPNIEFTGKLSSPQVAEILSRARGYLAMAEEDFGIANVEALASGTPVIAWGKAEYGIPCNMAKMAGCLPSGHLNLSMQQWNSLSG
ncbi:glycosyltransferase [Deinococcus radiodurans]|nr:glycosyltransferase [Deinococcus radiodurans]